MSLSGAALTGLEQAKRLGFKLGRKRNGHAKQKVQGELGLATAESYELTAGGNRVIKNGSMDDTREVIDALLSRFPAIQGPALKDICYATQNRQTAVKDMIGSVDVLIVVGSENSSNSNRLRELGERGGEEVRKGLPSGPQDGQRHPSPFTQGAS